MTAAGGASTDAFGDYADRLARVLKETDWTPIRRLAEDLLAVWRRGDQLFFCGNGGSAGNANHLANDFLYGIGGGEVPGLRVHSLTANPAVLTCLANDRGYEQAFALQLRTLARPGDILVALSGSGRSPNILAALAEARSIGVRSYAILGYTGGEAKEAADVAMHFPVEDMQIAEDLQVVCGHMVVQWLAARRGSVRPS